jgi:O-antigen/teichoic acid export membrane protein
MYPRLNEHVGKHENAHSVDEYTIYPAVTLTFIMPLLVSLGIIGLPFVVSRFLPAYRPGIFSAQILLIGLSVNGVNILNSVMKQNLYLLIQFVAVVLNLALNAIFITMRFQLAGVAAASALTFVLYKLAVSFFSLRIMHKPLPAVMKFLNFLWIFPIATLVFVALLMNNSSNPELYAGAFILIEFLAVGLCLRSLLQRGESPIRVTLGLFGL